MRKQRHRVLQLAWSHTVASDDAGIQAQGVWHQPVAFIVHCPELLLCWKPLQVPVLTDSIELTLSEQLSPSAFRSSQSSVQSQDYIRKSPYWEGINLLSMILSPDSQLTQDSTASQEEHYRKPWKNNLSPLSRQRLLLYFSLSPSPPSLSSLSLPTFS